MQSHIPLHTSISRESSGKLIAYRFRSLFHQDTSINNFPLFLLNANVLCATFNESFLSTIRCSQSPNNWARALQAGEPRPKACGAPQGFTAARLPSLAGTGWHCAYLSLWHNRNVQHSVDELNLRHFHIHVHFGLLELVLQEHRDVSQPRRVGARPPHIAVSAHQERIVRRESRILPKKVTTTTANPGNRQGFCVSSQICSFSCFFLYFLISSFFHLFHFFSVLKICFFFASIASRFLVTFLLKNMFLEPFREVPL